MGNFKPQIYGTIFTTGVLSVVFSSLINFYLNKYNKKETVIYNQNQYIPKEKFPINWVEQYDSNTNQIKYYNKYYNKISYKKPPDISNILHNDMIYAYYDNDTDSWYLFYYTNINDYTKWIKVNN